MKSKSVVSLLILSLAIAVSCSNEIIPDASITSQPGSKLAFEKMKASDGTIRVTTEFQYDASNQLASRISYDQSGVVSSRQDYFYENNQLVRTETMTNLFSSSSSATQYMYFYSTYEYDQDLLIRRNSFSKQGGAYEQKSYTIYQYNDSDLPIKQSTFLMTGELARYTAYAYDPAGNVLEVKEYDVVNKLGLTLETHYEYDSKNNPFRSVYAAAELIPYSINQNNITKSTSINHVYPSTPSGDVGKSITDYRQYNSDGYPVVFSENGGLDIIYEYK